MFLSKPVIAAVSGHSVAGGLELAIWADLRIIDDTSVFGVFCRTKGVPLIDGGTVRHVSLRSYIASNDTTLILTHPVGTQTSQIDWLFCCDGHDIDRETRVCR
jgi:enoyl-CoA hydratase